MFNTSNDKGNVSQVVHEAVRTTRTQEQNTIIKTKDFITVTTQTGKTAD
jgi:hypothetical protein